MDGDAAPHDRCAVGRFAAVVDCVRAAAAVPWAVAARACARTIVDWQGYLADPSLKAQAIACLRHTATSTASLDRAVPLEDACLALRVQHSWVMDGVPTVRAVAGEVVGGLESVQGKGHLITVLLPEALSAVPADDGLAPLFARGRLLRFVVAKVLPGTSLGMGSGPARSADRATAVGAGDQPPTLGEDGRVVFAKPPVVPVLDTTNPEDELLVLCAASMSLAEAVEANLGVHNARQRPTTPDAHAGFLARVAPPPRVLAGAPPCPSRPENGPAWLLQEPPAAPTWLWGPEAGPGPNASSFLVRPGESVLVLGPSAPADPGGAMPRGLGCSATTIICAVGGHQAPLAAPASPLQPRAAPLGDLSDSDAQARGRGEDRGFMAHTPGDGDDCCLVTVTAWKPRVEEAPACVEARAVHVAPTAAGTRAPATPLCLAASAVTTVQWPCEEGAVGLAPFALCTGLGQGPICAACEEAGRAKGHRPRTAKAAILFFAPR